MEESEEQLDSFEDELDEEEEEEVDEVGERPDVVERLRKECEGRPVSYQYPSGWFRPYPVSGPSVR